MKIADILKPECIIPDLDGKTKKDILAQLARPISESYKVDLDEMVSALLNREKLGSTGIGDGVAIPHAKVNGLSSIVASVGISREGLKFDALDGKPCHIFFLLMAPANTSSGHLKALARISMLLKNPDTRNRLIEARDAKDLYAAIMEQDSKLPL